MKNLKNSLKMQVMRKMALSVAVGVEKVAQFNAAAEILKFHLPVDLLRSLVEAAIDKAQGEISEEKFASLYEKHLAIVTQRSLSKKPPRVQEVGTDLSEPIPQKVGSKHTVKTTVAKKNVKDGKGK